MTPNTASRWNRFSFPRTRNTRSSLMFRLTTKPFANYNLLNCHCWMNRLETKSTSLPVGIYWPWCHGNASFVNTKKLWMYVVVACFFPTLEYLPCLIHSAIQHVKAANKMREIRVSMLWGPRIFGGSPSCASTVAMEEKTFIVVEDVKQSFTVIANVKPGIGRSTRKAVDRTDSSSSEHNVYRFWNLHMTGPTRAPVTTCTVRIAAWTEYESSNWATLLVALVWDEMSSTRPTVLNNYIRPLLVLGTTRGINFSWAL